MIRVSRRAVIGLAVAATVVSSGAGLASWFGLGSNDTGPVYTGLVEGTGAGGYDVVAYFKEGKAVEGSPAIVASWRDAQWRFSSEENKAAFLADPGHYAPAFGGYCSWAVAKGKLAKGDPMNWDIVDGRLYLNYNDKVQANWREDIPNLIAKGEKNWPGLSTRK